MTGFSLKNNDKNCANVHSGLEFIQKNVRTGKRTSYAREIQTFRGIGCTMCSRIVVQLVSLVLAAQSGQADY